MLSPILPNHRELQEAPERANLAMLRTAAVLAARSLELRHGDLACDFPPPDISQRPTTLIASLLLGRLDELFQLLDWYEDAVSRSVPPQRLSRSDLPF
jgi:hypothetical protein